MTDQIKVDERDLVVRIWDALRSLETKGVYVERDGPRLFEIHLHHETWAALMRSAEPGSIHYENGGEPTQRWRGMKVIRHTEDMEPGEVRLSLHVDL